MKEKCQEDNIDPVLFEVSVISLAFLLLNTSDEILKKLGNVAEVLSERYNKEKDI